MFNDACIVCLLMLGLGSAVYLADLNDPIDLPAHPELEGDKPIEWQPSVLLPGFRYGFRLSKDALAALSYDQLQLLSAGYSEASPSSAFSDSYSTFLGASSAFAYDEIPSSDRQYSEREGVPGSNGLSYGPLPVDSAGSLYSGFEQYDIPSTTGDQSSFTGPYNQNDARSCRCDYMLYLQWGSCCSGSELGLWLLPTKNGIGLSSSVDQPDPSSTVPDQFSPVDQPDLSSTLPYQFITIDQPVWSSEYVQEFPSSSSDILSNVDSTSTDLSGISDLQTGLATDYVPELSNSVESPSPNVPSVVDSQSSPADRAQPRSPPTEVIHPESSPVKVIEPASSQADLVQSGYSVLDNVQPDLTSVLAETATIPTGSFSNGPDIGSTAVVVPADALIFCNSAQTDTNVNGACTDTSLFRADNRAAIFSSGTSRSNDPGEVPRSVNGANDNFGTSLEPIDPLFLNSIPQSPPTKPQDPDPALVLRNLPVIASDPNATSFSSPVAVQSLPSVQTDGKASKGTPFNIAKAIVALNGLKSNRKKSGSTTSAVDSSSPISSPQALTSVQQYPHPLSLAGDLTGRQQNPDQVKSRKFLSKVKDAVFRKKKSRPSS